MKRPSTTERSTATPVGTEAARPARPSLRARLSARLAERRRPRPSTPPRDDGGRAEAPVQRAHDAQGAALAPPPVEEFADAPDVERLRAAGEGADRAAVDAAWGDTSRAARRRAPVVVAYARALRAQGDTAGAAKALESLLAADWHAPAVELYGELDDGDVLPRLKRAEEWLRTRREDPVLLVACARLCIVAELYGRARSFLETSQARRPRPETAQLLARLLERLGERDRALEVLHEGLALATGRRATLPPLRSRPLGVPRAG